MLIVRKVKEADLEPLYDLIGQAELGLTSLAISKQKLRSRIERSVFAFSRDVAMPEGEPPRGCCGKHAINSTLASKLERALAWQLSLSRKNNASRTTATTGSGDSYGMFVTADGRFSGRPLRAKGITSSSAMWDQIRMGWKCVFLFSSMLWRPCT